MGNVKLCRVSQRAFGCKVHDAYEGHQRSFVFPSSDINVLIGHCKMLKNVMTHIYRGPNQYPCKCNEITSSFSNIRGSCTVVYEITSDGFTACLLFKICLYKIGYLFSRLILKGFDQCWRRRIRLRMVHIVARTLRKIRTA